MVRAGVYHVEYDCLGRFRLFRRRDDGSWLRVFRSGAGRGLHRRRQLAQFDAETHADAVARARGLAEEYSHELG